MNPDILEAIDKAKEANDRAKRIRDENLAKGKPYWEDLPHGHQKVMIGLEDIKHKKFSECLFHDLYSVFQHYRKAEDRYRQIAWGDLTFSLYVRRLDEHLKAREALHKEHPELPL